MKQYSMNLRLFQQKFQTESACQQHLFSIRWPDGFCCPKCGHREYYKISKPLLFQCKSCRHQTSLTAGTILHKTRTPLPVWFWALFLVAHDKRGISAVAVARELDVTYKTGWLMLHKIRRAMQEREQQYMLSGIVEMDEAYFGGPGEEPRRGRGTNKTPVLVAMALSRFGKPRYLKMRATDDVRSDTLVQFVTEAMDDDVTIVNDGFGAYRKLAETYKTLTMKFDPTNNPDHMRWAHKAISNAKAFIAGTYHGIKGKHLQAYLDEYDYRYNSRNFQGEWFNRLLHAAVSTKTVTYSELTE